MKTFLDLLAIEPDITIDIQLSPLSANGYPTAGIKINDKILWHGPMIEPLRLNHKVDLLDPIDISITMMDKQYDQVKETALIINHLYIDDWNVIPGWTHLANYHNEQGCTGPASYLGFNGTWNLQIHKPFYQWRHRVTGQGWLLEPIRA